MMTANVENAVCGKKPRAVYTEPTAKVCANCEWFDQHYSKGWGNVVSLTPVNSGCCLRDGKSRKPFERACGKFSYPTGR